MSLEFELCLKRPFTLLAHEALLNIYYSASCLKKKAGEFLRPSFDYSWRVERPGCTASIKIKIRQNKKACAATLKSNVIFMFFP